VPSWDEPDYKASFDLSAIIPADEMAISNMPAQSSATLADGLKRVTFETTPVMSSYLLFFAKGDFGRISKMAGNTEVGIVVSRGNEEKARTALDDEAQILPYYNDYFGTPYPLPKLDNVGGPGQSQFFGAMENWGAIFTFERILLDDPAITSESERHAIFSVQAHEMAHQWFGDLVTMAWWDDLWLNEGFASWMESKTTQHFHPDWGADIDAVGGREAAMEQDAYVTTHPIVQKIMTVEQTNQAFDSITYSKGESVISMLEGYAGPDVWRRGIQDYVKTHQYQNTKTDDLWRSVEAAGAIGLTTIAHDFTLQPGIPLITVGKAQCIDGKTRVTLTQGQFSRDKREAVAAKPLTWHVPVSAWAGGATATAVTAGRATDVTVAGCGPLLVNAGQTGYYRTLYTADQLVSLQNAFGSLDAVDQYGLLNDSLALSYAGYQPIGRSLDLIAAIPASANRKVLTEGLGTLYSLYDMFEGDSAIQAKLATMIRSRYAPVLAQIGLVPRAHEPVLDTTLRPSLIGALGAVGDSDVRAEGDRLFAALQTDQSAISGSLKSTWLGLVAYNATPAQWDQLHAMAMSTTGAVERSTLYSLLGVAKDQALAHRALELALTDEPGSTVSAGMFNAVARRNPELALDFVLAHLDRVNALVDSSAASRFVARLGGGSDEEATIGKLDAYAKGNLDASARTPIDAAINGIRTRLADRPRIKKDIRAWVAGQ
jgi:aminopeptidase N